MKLLIAFIVFAAGLGAQILPPLLSSGASSGFNGYTYQRSITIPFGQVFAGTYTSGITATGTVGQTCTLAFSNGGGSSGAATVALTGTNAIASGTFLVLTAFGNSYTSAPTAATVTAGSATCTGPATIATVLQSAQTNFSQLICANGSAPCNGSVSGLNQSGGGAHVLNLVNGLAFAAYVTGITATGAAGTTCNLSGFNNGLSGAAATVALTATNTISTSGNVTLVIQNIGSGATSAPTSAAVASGTATCSGTASLSGAILYTGPADLTFTSDSGCASPLPFDVENAYTASTGALYAHVLVSPSGTAPTVIYMCYGNAAITTYQGGAIGGAYDANTWGLWHLGNGTTLNLKDSGPNGINLYLQGTATYSATTSAQIDGGMNYTVNATNGGATSIFNTSFASAVTMECWINPTGTLSSTQPMIMARAGGTNDFYMQILSATSLRLDINNSAGSVTLGGSISQSGMQHVVGVANGTNYIAYLNGVQAGLTANTHTTAGTAGYAFALGNNNASGQPYLGILDECSVSSTARSGSWIAMEYGMAAIPYITFGSEL
jgi:hypothetical protein